MSSWFQSVASLIPFTGKSFVLAYKVSFICGLLYISVSVSVRKGINVMIELQTWNIIAIILLKPFFMQTRI